MALRTLLPFLLVLIPTACATPGGNCARESRRELETVDRLIAETRVDLARGYSEREEGGPVAMNLCLGGYRSHVGMSVCADPTRRRAAVPVDQASAQRKLSALETRRAALVSQVNAETASCNAAKGVAR